jgi:hypothetical protein
MALLRIGLITLFSIVFLTSCFDYEDVEFKGVQNIGLEGRSGGNITVRIDMKVNNPNNYNIKIKKSSLDDVVLKKNHQDVYPLYLTFSEKELKSSALASIGSLLTGRMKVRIKGNIKAKVYGIGKKFPIDVEEPVNLSSLF